MTRTAVDATVSRLKAWVNNVATSGQYTTSCYDVLDDLEDLRQHDEAQAAEVERLRERVTELERMLRSIRDTTETWL